jgi:hypothetical protein
MKQYPKFIPNGKFNKFGFYRVGDECFYSKLDAIHHSMATGQEVTWDFNNDLFESLDWTTEPKETIQELYKKRAQQIRDRYDYVVILFSGGCDSTCVLDSFIDNDIHVDEVWHLHTLDGHKGNMNAFMTGETFHLAIPHALEKLKNCPDTRFTLCDNSDWERQNLQDPEVRKYAWRAFNNIHNLAMTGFYHSPTVGFHRRYQRWCDIQDSGKAMCFVIAEAKPYVNLDPATGKYYYRVLDHYASMPSPHVQWVNDPRENYENFFTQPDLPELMIKQAHLLLNAVRDFDPEKFWVPSDHPKYVTSPWGFEASDPRVSFLWTTKDDITYNMIHADYHALVYPSWKPGYTQWKQRGRAVHPWHQWLAEEMPTEAKQWYIAYLSAFANLPEYWTMSYGDCRGQLAYNLRRLENHYLIE